MSTVSIGQHETADGGAGTRLAAAVRRLWAAYITWRIEQAAIVALHSMSDLELKDIWLPRSEIEGAVKGRYPRQHSAPAAE